MKALLLLLFLCSLAACTSTVPTDTPPVVKTIPSSAPPTSLQRPILEEAPLKTATLAFVEQYGSQYSKIAYSLLINNSYYFVVVNGNWSLTIQKEKLAEGAAPPYQMGLVNAQNDVLIPIKFDKIYNMGGTAANLFEVEWQGKHGLYNLQGTALLKEHYDAIYPATKASNTWAYWRKGNQFGVLYGDGSIDSLEEQPADLLQNWAFDTELTSIIPFVATGELLDENSAPWSKGVLVFPSYLYDLSIAPEYEYNWAYTKNDLGMSYSKANIEPLATKNTTTLLTAFNQAFIESRSYHDDKQSVVTVDQNYQPVDSILIQTLQQLPVCAVLPKIRLIGEDTIEVAQVQPTPQQTYSYQTIRRYYHLKENGELEHLIPQGHYTASQYIPLTEEALKGCFARSLTEEEREALKEEDYATFEVSQHLSVEDLDYMLKEIYARHGYTFKDKKWQKRFAQEPWYQGTEEEVEHLLSPLEKRNAQFLLEYQEVLKGKEKEMRQTVYEAGHYAG